jgi:hypothetical protein
MPKLAEFLKRLGIHRQINVSLNVSGGIWVKVGCIAHLTAILDKRPGSFPIGGQYKVAVYRNT